MQEETQDHPEGLLFWDTESKQTASTQPDLQAAQRLILYISLLTALLTEKRRREKMKIKGFWPMLTTITFCTKLSKTTFLYVGVPIL